jgi:hypothetical protein
MANEIVKINGVTKQEDGGNYVYFFPTCFIKGYPNATNPYYEQQFSSGEEMQVVLFSQITDKLGTTNIIDYIDKLAELGYFFDNSNIGESGGGIVIATDDLSKMHSYRNAKLMIGDTDDEVILFSFKKTGTTTIKLKRIEMHFLIVSNDYAHIRFHKNPTYTGSLTYSQIQGSFVTAASGDDNSPSATQISSDGTSVQSIGFVDQRNYGKELSFTASIDIADNNDEFVFSAICGANDTKIFASINFIEE